MTSYALEFQKRGVAVVFDENYPLVLRAVDDWRLVVTPDFSRFVLMRRMLPPRKGFQAQLWAYDLEAVRNRLRHTVKYHGPASVASLSDGLPEMPEDCDALPVGRFSSGAVALL